MIQMQILKLRLMFKVETVSDETKSVTEEALQQALESLIDDNAKEWVYLNIPNDEV